MTKKHGAPHAKKGHGQRSKGTKVVGVKFQMTAAAKHLCRGGSVKHI